MGDFCIHLRKIGYLPRIIVDVGAADGTLDLYEPFPESHLVLVEPVAEYKSALDEVLSKRSGEWHQAAAGAENGEISITVGESAESLQNSRISDKGNRKVPKVRIDDLIGNREGPILLKVDVEGFELDVVEGAARVLERCDVVILETRLFDSWGFGAPIFHEVVIEMANKGYRVYDVISLMSRPLDAALVLCDIVFVRADSWIVADSSWATTAQLEASERRLGPRLRRWLGA